MQSVNVHALTETILNVVTSIFDSSTVSTLTFLVAIKLVLTYDNQPWSLNVSAWAQVIL